MDDRQIWHRMVLVSLLLIILSVPLAWLFHRDLQPGKHDITQATFVGRKACVECHRTEDKLWQGSHHANSMAVANDATVLGDFNNAVFASRGIETRFYKKDGKFFVRTRGEDGKDKEYQITHTFGYTPLQQYLVPFPGGRFQCLPVAWDTENGRWFDLAEMVYPEEDLNPSNWLYWTNQSQNWNGMCAECHSTNLKKNYNPQQKNYHTSWSEINVSCESCHGPGSAHLDWAKLPEMDRDDKGNLGLTVRTSLISSRQQVELCAPCHSRRGGLQNFEQMNRPVLDYIDPQLPVEPVYFIDGQIREEDYVYGSFTQSKMYLRDVRCSDCHNVHSGKLLFKGNKLCLQCHIAADYDVYEHHFHKKTGEKGQPVILSDGHQIDVGTGAQCINCHMPARTYMGIDLRNDHSLRIPRPDLSMELGTPNACQNCHRDKSDDWSQNYIEQWYGKNRRSHYGEVFAKAAGRTLENGETLKQYLNQDLYPDMVRATAVYYMANDSDPSIKESVKAALADAQPIVRLTAVRNFNAGGPEELKTALLPLLRDPVKAVRIHAANQLMVLPPDQLSNRQRDLLKQVLSEYEDTLNYTADFATTQHNLGLYYYNLNQLDQSIRHYQEALRIDKDFYPSRVNLAILQYNKGQLNAALQSFLNLKDNHPEFLESWYYLGLLYAEQQQYQLAVEHLEKALQLTPHNKRIAYNLGLIYQKLKQPEKAEQTLLRGFRQSGGTYDYAFALADFYFKNGDRAAAETYARKMLQSQPNDPNALGILQAIQRMK